MEDAPSRSRIPDWTWAGACYKYHANGILLYAKTMEELRDIMEMLLEELARVGLKNENPNDLLKQNCG